MFRLFVAIAIVCSCSLALAQKKMYRCGNQFQERPCEGPKADTAPSAAVKADPLHRDRLPGGRQGHQSAQCRRRPEEF